LRVDHDYVSTAGFDLSNSTPGALGPAIDDTYTKLIVRVRGAGWPSSVRSGSGEYSRVATGSAVEPHISRKTSEMWGPPRVYLRGGILKNKGTDETGWFRPSLCRNHSCALLGVGGSGGMLLPVGLPALRDLLVLLFLGVVQDRLYATVTILADAVHLCLSIAGSERGIGA
jgi:hypothetical protein